MSYDLRRVFDIAETNQKKIAQIEKCISTEKQKSHTIINSENLKTFNGEIIKSLEFYSYNEKTALQLAFKKYGVSNFNFEIIEKCDNEKLNERGYIVPGMGDAGDRIFNTLQ